MAHIALAPPSIIGVGHAPGCMTGTDPTPYLRLYNAQVLRVIINPGFAPGTGLDCIRDAVAAGYKAHLVIQWWNAMSPRQVAVYVAAVLPAYAPYLWAVSLGNEQELYQGSYVRQTGTQYAATWRAAEPVVAAVAPHAIRVAGEATPWGLSFLAGALKAGLPGVQALSAHPYNDPHGASPSAFVALASAHHLAMWFTEGLVGPGSWGGACDISRSAMAGAVVGDVWLA